jgi:hypothetical protein
MPIISVENTVDLADIPANFTYVNDYVCGDGVIIPDDPPCTTLRLAFLYLFRTYAYTCIKHMLLPLYAGGCDCIDGCHNNKKTCCPATNNQEFAYTSFKR